MRHRDPRMRMRVRVGATGVRAEVGPTSGTSVPRLYAELKREMAAAAPYALTGVLVAELSDERLVIDARRRRR